MYDPILRLSKTLMSAKTRRGPRAQWSAPVELFSQAGERPVDGRLLESYGAFSWVLETHDRPQQVVLPAPLGPITVTISPSLTSRLTSRRI